MQYFVVFTPKESGSGGPPLDFRETELKEEAQERVLYADGGPRQA